MSSSSSLSSSSTDSSEITGSILLDSCFSSSKASSWVSAKASSRVSEFDVSLTSSSVFSEVSIISSLRGVSFVSLTTVSLSDTTST